MDRCQRKLVLSGALILGLTFGASSVFAAKAVNLSRQSVSVLQSFVSPSKTFGRNDNSTQIAETSRSLDEKGTLHVRVQETYAGYPVWGADAVVHIPQGEKTGKSFARIVGAAQANKGFMNGTIYQNVNKDLANTPQYVFDKAQAQKALQFAINDYQKKLNNNSVVTEQKSQLMVYIDNDQKAHWAYEVNFFVPGAKVNEDPANPVYILDAVTFQTYQQWNDLKTLSGVGLDDADGGGFGGNKKMGQLVYDRVGEQNANNHAPGHLFSLKMQRDAATKTCYLQNTDVKVEKCTSFWGQCGSSVPMTVACSEVDPAHNKIYWNGSHDAVNGAYSPANDALFGGLVIKRLYQNWYGLPVLTDRDGKPLQLKMVVHLERYENAYWKNGVMYFGDGQSRFYPLVSLGVSAHEISHGFTEQHSGLRYAGQSGGLNEAFSDIAVQAAEYFAYSANKDWKNNWQIGPEIFKAENQALRYMDQPSKDCRGGTPGRGCSIDDASQYKEGIDVHYSSGVYNRFFYLLATSDNWNTRKAFDVMVKANLNYWTKNSNFEQTACGIVSATKDKGYDVQAVYKALAVVKVKTPDCPNPEAPQQNNA